MRTRRIDYGESRPTSSKALVNPNPLHQIEPSQSSSNFLRKRKRTEDMAQPRSLSTSTSTSYVSLNPFERMTVACRQHDETFFKLLPCDGTNDPEGFWKLFTRRFVRELGLGLEITDDSVAACESYARVMYYEMQRTDKAIRKLRAKQQTLIEFFDVYKFPLRKRGRDGNMRSSSMSTSDNRLTATAESSRQDQMDDGDVLEQRLSLILSPFLAKDRMSLDDIDFVSSFFKGATTRVPLLCFLKLDDPEAQWRFIEDILKKRPSDNQ